MTKSYSPLYINLPTNLFEQVSDVSEALGKTKSAFLRQCIVRNIEFVRVHELPRLDQDRVLYHRYQKGDWMSTGQ